MKKIIWVCVIAAAVTLYFYPRLTQDKSKVGKTSEEESVKGFNGKADLEQKVTSFTIDGRSPKGVKQWHLEGTSAEIMDDEIHLNNLKAVAYADGSTVNLTSDRGIYRKEKGEVELMGNVRVFSDDGTLLITERAKWSQLTKDISTDVAVRVERDGLIATGIGAVANSSNKTASLLKDVEVIIEPNTKVKSSGPMTIDYGNNIAIFYDNVVVEDKDGKLSADKLTINFDAETKKVAEVVAEGNAKIWRGKSYTMSEKVIYNGSTKSAKLIGRPKVVISPEDIKDLGELGG